jgi:hypothetical protein
MFPFWLEFEPTALAELTTLIVAGIAVFFTSGILFGGRV